MKILVISDTHHNIENATKLIKRLNPDYVLHLGDMCEDSVNLERRFQQKIIVSVLGNNDYFNKTYPLERCFSLSGKKIFMCHGHKYNVKSSLLSLMYKADEVGADIVLFGHTHIPYLEKSEERLVMNPGAYMTYGIIEISDGKIEAKIEKYE